MTRSTRVAIYCLAGLLGSCAKSSSPGELEKSVHGYCFDLEEAVGRAAERHHQLAPALDDKSLSADQLTRANDDLAATSVGNTLETRRSRLLDFESHFQFCKLVHQMDDAQSKQFSARLAGLHDQLSQNIGTGEMPSAKTTAEALDQLRSLVHEVNALPLKR